MMHDPYYTYRTGRSAPSQARGKERVRRILSASLKLFAQRGLEDVTTNDIAKAAGIPIGSLYRYYPNKEAVISALTTVYTSDLSAVFIDIATHPLLKRMSWNEVLFLVVEAWVQYARLNGPFAFLYTVSSNPRLIAQNKEAWASFVGSFDVLLAQRCPYIDEKERFLCFRFCMTAAEIGIASPGGTATDTEDSPLHFEATEIIGAYMERACLKHSHRHDSLLVIA